jgi:hypothetical protein
MADAIPTKTKIAQQIDFVFKKGLSGVRYAPMVAATLATMKG